MMFTNDIRRWQPWSILGLSFLTALLVFTGILPQLRPVVVLIFYVTCPGLAFVRLLRLRDPLVEVVLMFALSLVIDSAVAMFLLYTGAWSYVTGLLMIIGISLVGIMPDIRERSLAAHTPRVGAQLRLLFARVRASMGRPAQDLTPENVALPEKLAMVEYSALPESQAVWENRVVVLIPLTPENRIALLAPLAPVASPVVKTNWWRKEVDRARIGLAALIAESRAHLAALLARLTRAAEERVALLAAKKPPSEDGHPARQERSRKAKQEGRP